MPDNKVYLFSANEDGLMKRQDASSDVVACRLFRQWVKEQRCSDGARCHAMRSETGGCSLLASYIDGQYYVPGVEPVRPYRSQT